MQAYCVCKYIYIRTLFLHCYPDAMEMMHLKILCMKLAKLRPLVPARAIKAYSRQTAAAPLILNLDTRW